MGKGIPTENMIFGVLIPPQSIGTTPVSASSALTRPWEIGRYLTLFTMGGALVAADVITMTISLLNSSFSASTVHEWEDSGTPLRIPAAKLSDAGDGENALLNGTIDLSRLQVGKNYQAFGSGDADPLQLSVSLANANNSTPGYVGVGYCLSGLYEHPAASAAATLAGAATVEEMFYGMTPHSD